MSQVDIVVDGFSLNFSYGNVLLIGENLADTDLLLGDTLISSDNITSTSLSVSNQVFYFLHVFVEFDFPFYLFIFRILYLNVGLTLETAMITERTVRMNWWFTS